MPGVPEARYLTCRICSQLRARENALEHVQASEADVHLPEAVNHLEVALEIQRAN
jgi:hypothetical protein